MVFSSLLFLFRFLPIMLVVYYCTPRRFRNAVLFGGSLVFYAWGEPAGTTIEAVRVLEEKGLRSAVIEGQMACVKKAREL